MDVYGEGRSIRERLNTNTRDYRAWRELAALNAWCVIHGKAQELDQILVTFTPEARKYWRGQALLPSPKYQKHDHDQVAARYTTSVPSYCERILSKFCMGQPLEREVMGRSTCFLEPPNLIMMGKDDLLSSGALDCYLYNEDTTFNEFVTFNGTPHLSLRPSEAYVKLIIKRHEADLWERGEIELLYGAEVIQWVKDWEVRGGERKKPAPF